MNTNINTYTFFKINGGHSTFVLYFLIVLLRNFFFTCFAMSLHDDFF